MTQSKADCNPIPNTHYALPETVIWIYSKLKVMTVIMPCLTPDINEYFTTGFLSFKIHLPVPPPPLMFK